MTEPRAGPTEVNFAAALQARESEPAPHSARLLRAGETLAKVSLPVLSTGDVLDADDTSGEVLALSALVGESDAEELRAAAAAGLDWLVGLANRDGGLPTFCRGWGRLPLDTSCPNITAHSLRTAATWPAAGQPRREIIAKAQRYLAQTQQADGSFGPTAGLPTTIEETALAVEALAATIPSLADSLQAEQGLQQSAGALNG